MNQAAPNESPPAGRPVGPQQAQIMRTLDVRELQVVHPPIISDETFHRAQQLLAARNARQVTRRPRTSPPRTCCAGCCSAASAPAACKAAGTTTKATTAGRSHAARTGQLREEIGTCGQKLAQYRAALDSGAGPGVVGQWITQTQARKLAADARLRAADGTRSAPARMSKDQIAATSAPPRPAARTASQGSGSCSSPGSAVARGCPAPCPPR